MKHFLSVILAFCVCMAAWADNFTIKHGEALKLFCSRESGTMIERADRLFEQDYHEVFGENVVHTNLIADAKIIVGNYDDSAIKKFARIRGISFDKLAGHKGAFMLKVNNNGRQLFVVGSDDMGTAFGLMTLSRIWGVSPFRWWADAPALQMDAYELGVAYEEFFEATVPTRTLILNGAQQHDNYMQDLLLRLRATGLSNDTNAASADSTGVFRWTLKPAQMPYLGLGIYLDAPERIRLEALRAYDMGRKEEWQIQWEQQMGGELQLFLFFDMAWNVHTYRNAYAIDELEDLHFTQMSGQNCNWSQVWNDFFDLTMMFHPEQPLSFEALRRGIGESQNLQLQLSLELNDKVVSNDYANAYFRTVEYPINMVTSQMQRLCNMQLVQHEAAKPWAVEDCRQRMELLANVLPTLVAPKWQQMMSGTQVPVMMDQSMMQVDDNNVLTPMQIGTLGPLPTDEGSDLIYRSKRATGTLVKPFEAMRLPLVYKAETVHLKVSLLPTRSYGKMMNCMISIGKGVAQLLRIDQDKLSETQQVYDLEFTVDPTVDEHDVVLRTTSDAIYLQRIWLTDMK